MTPPKPLTQTEIAGILYLRGDGRSPGPTKAVLRRLQVRGLVREGRLLTPLGHATAYRVLGPRCGECADCQEWQLSKQDAAACMPEALRTAQYFGAECAANPGTSIMEYQADMALRAGHASWRETPIETKRKLTSGFLKGKREEERNG